MRVGVVVEPDGTSELLAAQVAFHLAAGADEVIASMPDGGGEPAAQILEPFVESGAVAIVGGARGALPEWPSVARALREREIDWVATARPGDFWWSRFGILHDVLALVPERFSQVYAARRGFFLQPEDGRHAVERNTLRPALGSTAARAGITSLRRVPAASTASISARRRDPRPAGSGVLCGWYPFEVLHIPFIAGSEGIAGAAEGFRSSRASGEIVVDARVRDALRSIAGVHVLAPDAAFPVDRLLGGLTLSVTGRDLAEDVALVSELQGALGAEPPMSIDARVAALERRVRVLEEGLLARARRFAERYRAGSRTSDPAT